MPHSIHGFGERHALIDPRLRGFEPATEQLEGEPDLDAWSDYDSDAKAWDMVPLIFDTQRPVSWVPNDLPIWLKTIWG